MIDYLLTTYGFFVALLIPTLIPVIMVLVWMTRRILVEAYREAYREVKADFTDWMMRKIELQMRAEMVMYAYKTR